MKTNISEWGKNLRLTVSGTSHGEFLGLTLSGVPKGVRYDEKFISALMKRRAPGGAFATKRKEADEPVILSGFSDGISDGTPIEMRIYNQNQRSADYGEMIVPRPNHADYVAKIKYHGDVDLRGGGHFSARMTAPMVFAGGICMLAQKELGIRYVSHILKVGRVEDRRFTAQDFTEEGMKELFSSPFPVLTPEIGERMKEEITACAGKGDSVGAVLECAVIGLPIGIGTHMFRGVEGTLSSLLYSIPAVKGVDFGEGFAFSDMHGSEANDGYRYENGKVRFLSNHCGGILGGMTSGEPLIFRAAFKPTPSIYLEQPSVNLKTKENETLKIVGRHDPCVALRALPIIESAGAIGIEELLLDEEF